MTKNEKSKQKVEHVAKKPIPDGGYGWVVLAASFFISFILDGIMYSFGLMTSQIREHYNAKESEANLLQSLNTGFLLGSGPIVAGLTNTFGCRPVIMVGSIVTATLYFLCVLSPSIYPLWAFYGILGGVSTGCTYISSLIVIAEYFDKKVGVATGIVMAGSGVGSAILPSKVFGMEYYIITYDWKFAMSLCAAMILLCCALGSFLTPLNPNSSSSDEITKPRELKEVNKQSLNDENCHHNDDIVIQTYLGSMYSVNTKKLPFYQRYKATRVAVEILSEMTNFTLLWQNFDFFLIVMSNFFLFGGLFLPYIYVPRIAKAVMDDPTKLLSVIGLLNIPFRILFGWMATAKILSALNLNSVSVLIAVIPFFFYEQILQYSEIGQYVFCIAFAIGTAGMNSLTTAYLIDIVGLEKFGNSMGIINLFRGFGCSLGPVIGGFLLDQLKIPHANVFYFCGLLYVLGLLFTSFASLRNSCCSSKSRRESESFEFHKNNNESGFSKNLLKQTSVEC